MTQLEIFNKALRLLGLPRVTQADLDGDLTESARILNDIYESIRDEVLIEHPWNFAIKRANLTEVGGIVTTWTEEGTTNVWQAALTTEPARVFFNGTEGTEQTAVASLTAENYWYWESNVLYVYSTSDPDTAYDSPGIDAVISEYGYTNCFSLPTDYLRLIRMEDDDAEFVIEGSYLFTDETEAKVKYIAQITTEASFTSNFIMVLAQRLASEMTIPTTNSPNLAVQAFNLYKDKLSKAKAIDAQEGSGLYLQTSDWQDARE